MKGLLISFFETVNNLLEELRDCCTGIDRAEERGSIDEYRADADAKYIRIRKFLDGISDKFVSSDELVSYRWASTKIERCVAIYDQVHSLYRLGAYGSGGAEFPTSLLEEVFVFCKMMRREEEYASSSAMASSDSASSMSDEELDRDDPASRIQDGPVRAQGNNAEYENEYPAMSQESLPLDRDAHPEERVAGLVGVEVHHEDLADTEQSDADSDDSDAWMDVGENEIPAELSLAAYLSTQGGTGTAPGLEYMSPRVRAAPFHLLLSNSVVAKVTPASTRTARHHR